MATPDQAIDHADQSLSDGGQSGVRSVLQDFAPGRLPTTIAVGVMLGLVNALLGVALMSLVFSGDLADGLAVGIAVGLLGSAAAALVIALTSGFAGMYAGIQDNSAAIIALAAASIATAVVGPRAIDTVIVMMMVTSLAIGAVFLLMGRFRLGEIARFVPFPVIGGLLAGTGYLITVGALDLLDFDVSIDAFTSELSLGLLWPGLAFGLIFVVAAYRDWPKPIFLGLLTVGIGGFHIVTRVLDVDQQESLGRGWLLGPFPDGGLEPFRAIGAIADADWGAIGGEIASLATVLLLVPLTLLLYLSALEVGTNSDVDVNDELTSTGYANLAAGVFGAPPGYLYLSDTLIVNRLLGGRRGPPVIAALLILGVALVGSAVLELIPQFVIGGVLLFYGLEFMIEWLWTARRRMTRLDYGLMVGIVLIIATVGFLPGVAVGLAAAITLFVYRYSRIEVVKHSLTARDHQSNIERPLGDAEYLRSVGDQVVILELQGFIFFGTANQILDRMKHLIQDIVGVRYVIFGFRLVSGVDSSAVALFERITLLARDHDITLVFAGLRPTGREQFADLLAEYADVVVEQRDLDHATAWCEDHLLANVDRPETNSRALPDGLAAKLSPYLEPRTLAEGERFMTQGDPTPGIYLLTSGRATVLLERENEEDVRLRTIHEGTVLGEIGLYRNEPCTATVIAETECDVLQMTPEAFEVLCSTDHKVAGEFHIFVARILASRVSHGDRTIQVLRG
ncbi:MAG: cyclic nucleotide-binding domain-containing protein, partial [Acidimicrobiia bacterium]|nr:cyclic nucleotide-binding domain-containing protein [Acidimicrobiia bacterium]NNL27599.1 cyclic nucleotide-binding domain-containing protein [Acidimicrobiia bacterium]